MEQQFQFRNTNIFIELKFKQKISFEKHIKINHAFQDRIISFYLLLSNIILYGTENSVFPNGIVNPKGHKNDGSLLGNLCSSHHGFGPQPIFDLAFFTEVTFGKSRIDRKGDHELEIYREIFLCNVKIINYSEICLFCVCMSAWADVWVWADVGLFIGIFIPRTIFN